MVRFGRDLTKCEGAGVNTVESQSLRQFVIPCTDCCVVCDPQICDPVSLNYSSPNVGRRVVRLLSALMK